MTGSAVTCGALVSANLLAVATVAAAGTTAGTIDPILEYIQNGASVAAVMGLFLWREMKRAERYEHLYDEERKLRLQAENKCAACVFVKKANEAFLDERKE